MVIQRESRPFLKKKIKSKISTKISRGIAEHTFIGESDSVRDQGVLDVTLDLFQDARIHGQMLC